MNHPDAHAPGRTPRSGDLMRLVADRLEALGLGIRLPEGEEERRLTIEGGGNLLVDDGGQVRWECVLRAHPTADPGQIADVATLLLTGQEARCPVLDIGHEPPGLTLKGTVGRDLRQRGFGVDLESFEDSESCDVLTEIVVTGPGTGRYANVRVSDCGDITWERDYGPRTTAMPPAPDDPAQTALAAEAADSIAAMVARVLPLAAAITAGSGGQRDVSEIAV